MQLKMQPSIKTFDGTYFDFLNPTESMVSITSIAHALSNICRFTGHCRFNYSVAQHSYYVSLQVPEHLALQGLLHDAPEAYIGDVSSPLKQLLQDYRVIEERVTKVVHSALDLPERLAPEVKHADLAMLRAEHDQVLTNGFDPCRWDVVMHISPARVAISPWSSEEAEWMFLSRYAQLLRRGADAA